MQEGNVFTGAYHSFCPQRCCIPACNGAGGCVVQHAMEGGGVCLWGCLPREVSAQGGLYRRGVFPGGVRPRGCVCPGGWLLHPRDGHWSGRYASYKNAFLFWGELGLLCEYAKPSGQKVQENISHSAIGGICLLDLDLGTGSLHFSWIQLFSWPMCTNNGLCSNYGTLL